MNPPKDCPELEDLAAYLEGLSELAARDRIESHLASCAECRGEVRDYARLLKETSEAQDAPPPGFSASLIRASGARTHRRAAVPRKPAPVLALVAPGLLAALGVTF